MRQGVVTAFRTQKGEYKEGSSRTESNGTKYYVAYRSGLLEGEWFPEFQVFSSKELLFKRLCDRMETNR